MLSIYVSFFKIERDLRYNLCLSGSLCPTSRISQAFHPLAHTCKPKSRLSLSVLCHTVCNGPNTGTGDPDNSEEVGL